MHDLVIRNALVVDGTGAPSRLADVAVDGSLITEVGAGIGTGKRDIDALGLHLCPGWVDVHTHYDGQAIWDDELTPSAWHGVTTAVFGNCAVGFAPVRRGTEPFLINLMEGVEDIPGSVLAEGVTFTWESFPEYLDALDARSRTVDVGAQIPHGALRFFVMGERGADHREVPTAAEVAAMGVLVAESLEAGAFGLSTSRTIKHRAKDGRPTPSLSAGDDELFAIAAAMRRVGRGVIQANSDFNDPEEVRLLRRLGEASGRPVSFSLLQVDHAPERWRSLHAEVMAANDAGVVMKGQVASRAIGVIIGLQATVHPLLGIPAFDEIAHWPLDEMAAELARPERKQLIVSHGPVEGRGTMATKALGRIYDIGTPLDYEPDPNESVAVKATRAGRDPFEFVYDLLIADRGRKLLYLPFENYSYGNLDTVREMLVAPHTISGLSDGGAHVGTVCDASFPTFLLTHWVKGRMRGDRIPIEFLVSRQTRETAVALGMNDRGVIAPGFRADINLIDLDGLAIGAPHVVHDLPAGGRRLIQRATGYRHTFLAGVETYVDGVATGNAPGRLMRGPSQRV
jgi:N-acyl-D-aspartate/D-glutamate deacylase